MTDPESPPPDLLDSSHWRPLWQMLSAMDREIAAPYTEAGISDVRPRFVGPLIQLGRHAPMTIQQLADAVEVTHSAMSQTVTALRKAGLVDSADSPDARTRRIQLSAKARDLLPFLEAKWRATEAAVRELESETPYPLSQAVRDIQAALRRRPFRQRLADNLDRARDGRLA